MLFDRLADAVNTTIQTIQMGVPIARCELLDANTVRVVNQHSKLNLPESAMLLMEFHGSPDSVNEQVEMVQAIATENRARHLNGRPRRGAHAPVDGRHNAYFAGVQSRPAARPSPPTPACRSRLADALLDSVAGPVAGYPLLPGRSCG